MPRASSLQRLHPRSLHDSSRASAQKDEASVPARRDEGGATPTARQETIAEADERLRQLMLDRDGGPASVPTRNGKWESEMGRETARNMFRILDQSRQARPGAASAMGEGESKGWSRRNY